MIKDTLGRPIKDLRISVTDRCNFRCPYCMPAEIFGERYEFLPKTGILTFEEIARLTCLFVEFGVEKIRLTGGEPLLRADLQDLIKMLSEVEGVKDLALTTNAYLLPKMAQPLKEAGLQRITISLDSLDEDVFKQMNGLGYNIETALDGIKKAEEVGFHSIKFNTVVQKGINDHTLVDLAKHFKGTGHIVRFIEYMDVGNRNGWKMDEVVPAGEIIEKIHTEMPLEPIEPNYKGEVASRYRYTDGSGEIGVIASVTQPFCGNCNRARLSTDGKLYTCLFASHGIDLRDPMRKGMSDDDLRNLIAITWNRRKDRYSELRTQFTRFESLPPKIEMYQIGG